MTNPERPRHSVSVAAVVTDDMGRVLVVQRRDNGKWEIPGGILELGESLYAGMCREVEEETGLIVEPDQLTGVYKNVRLGVVALVFRAHVIGGESRQTDESTAVGWWTANEVTTHMSETFAIRVLDALDSTNAAVRLHDGVQLSPRRPHTRVSHDVCDRRSSLADPIGENFLYVFKAQPGDRRCRLRLRADPGRAHYEAPGHR